MLTTKTKTTTTTTTTTTATATTTTTTTFFGCDSIEINLVPSLMFRFPQNLQEVLKHYPQSSVSVHSRAAQGTAVHSTYITALLDQSSHKPGYKMETEGQIARIMES